MYVEIDYTVCTYSYKNKEKSQEYRTIANMEHLKVNLSLLLVAKLTNFILSQK